MLIHVLGYERLTGRIIGADSHARQKTHEKKYAHGGHRGCERGERKYRKNDSREKTGRRPKRSPKGANGKGAHKAAEQKKACKERHFERESPERAKSENAADAVEKPSRNASGSEKRYAQ